MRKLSFLKVSFHKDINVFLFSKQYSIMDNHADRIPPSEGPGNQSGGIASLKTAMPCILSNKSIEILTHILSFYFVIFSK